MHDIRQYSSGVRKSRCLLHPRFILETLGADSQRGRINMHEMALLPIQIPKTIPMILWIPLMKKVGNLHERPFL